MQSQKIEKIIKETGDKNLIKWANLMQKVRTRLKYGRITLIARNGMIDRIEIEREYDDCSDGL